MRSILSSGSLLQQHQLLAMLPLLLFMAMLRVLLCLLQFCPLLLSTILFRLVRLLYCHAVAAGAAGAAGAGAGAALVLVLVMLLVFFALFVSVAVRAVVGVVVFGSSISSSCGR